MAALKSLEYMKTRIHLYLCIPSKLAVAQKIYVSFYIHSSHDQYVITHAYSYDIALYGLKQLNP